MAVANGSRLQARGERAEAALATYATELARTRRRPAQERSRAHGRTDPRGRGGDRRRERRRRRDDARDRRARRSRGAVAVPLLRRPRRDPRRSSGSDARATSTSTQSRPSSGFSGELDRGVRAARARAARGLLRASPEPRPPVVRRTRLARRRGARAGVATTRSPRARKRILAGTGARSTRQRPTSSSTCSWSTGTARSTSPPGGRPRRPRGRSRRASRP